MNSASVFRIPSNISVNLGLGWDFVGENPSDLDVSVVAFDAFANIHSTIFFNSLTAEGGWMLHSGDNQTGEDEGEDDESVIFHMSKIPPEVKHMMVCVTSYTGADFTYVEKARVRVVNLATKETVGAFHLGVVGRHTATLLCVFARVPNEMGEEDTSSAGWWDLREINIPCHGYTFCDVIPKMLDLLGVPKEEHDAHLANLPDYSLEKKDPMWDLVLSNIKFGLGWDGENDLDASMVMLDEQGRYVDHLHAKYGRLRCGGSASDKDLLLAAAAQQSMGSFPAGGTDAFAAAPTHEPHRHARPGESPAMVGKNGGEVAAAGQQPHPPNQPQVLRVPVAEHSGDKLNGFDADGDDEFITVDLMRVDPRVHVVYFMVILFSGVAKHLSEVPKCYARFLNKKNAGNSKASGSFKEVDRLPISQLLDDESHTVLVPYAVYRKSHNSWTLVSVSELMSGRDWVDVFPFLRAFTALDVSCERWADWKRDIAPFAVRLTIRRVKDLGPGEPHVFACKCMAWVHDRHGIGRFITRKNKDKEKRHDIEFNESTTFFVDKLDVIRVLVFECAVVGHVDIPMAEFFPLTPPALTLDAMCIRPAMNNHNPINLSDPAQGGGQQNNDDIFGSAAAASAVGGPQARSPQHYNNAPPSAFGNNNHNQSPAASPLAVSTMSPGSAAQLGAAAAASVRGGHGALQGRARPVMDGETMLDQWLPLQGIGVQGEIQLLLERVPLAEAIAEQGRGRNPAAAQQQEEEANSSWCVIG